MSSDNSDYSTMSDKELDEEIKTYEKGLIIAKRNLIDDVENVLKKAKKEKQRRLNK